MLPNNILDLPKLDADINLSGSKPSGIRIFKLESGEEIVASVVGVTVNHQSGKIETYVLRRPVVMNIQANPQGGYGVVMMPWVLGNREADKVVVTGDRVVASTIASRETEDRYTQSTTNIDLSGSTTGVLR